MSTTYGPSNIDPAEWTHLGNFYQGTNIETHTEFAGEHDELQRNLCRVLDMDLGEDLWAKNAFSYVTFHANRGCASCGSRFMYGAVFVRGESELIAVGHDCGANLFGLTDLSEVTKRRAAKAREAAKLRAKFAAQIEADPDLSAAFERRFVGDPIDHPKNGYYLRGTGGSIVNDIFHKGNRYGSISERQAELVKKIVREHIEREAKKAEIEAELPPVEDIPVTDDRIEIIGTVISHRWDESDYGTIHKMLVESENGRWRVWGSVPAKIDDAVYNWEYDAETGAPIDADKELKGSKVRFFAKVEVSRDDSTFGFYKRPTKPELIEAGKEE